MANIAGFPGYAGWGQTEAEADFRATGGSGKGPPQQSSPGQSAQAAPIDYVAQAQKLNDFYKTQNQPAITNYQQQINPSDPNSIQARYDKILASIKQTGQVAENSATLAQNNLMSQRGISSDSPYYQSEMQKTLLPTQAAFGGLTANTQGAESQDINQINQAIAMLQRGNPESSVGASTQIGGIQGQLQQAQIASDTAIQNAKLQAQTQQQIAQLENQYRPIFPGGALYNTYSKQSVIPGLSSGVTSGGAGPGNNLDPALYYNWLSKQKG